MRNRSTPQRRDDRAASLKPTNNLFPSEEDRARWLFDFFRADLTTMSDGQLLDTRNRAQAFAVGFSSDSDTLSLEALSQLQAGLREGWARLRAGDWWTLDGPIAYGIAPMGRGLTRGERRGQFRDLFVAAAMDAVQECWNRIAECPRCKSVFVKTGKQRYCSPECSQKTRWDRFVSKTKRTRDYRAERTRAVRKRTGSNVKLATRSRRSSR